MMIREEGCIVHRFVPMIVTGWKDVKKEKGDELLRQMRMKERVELDRTQLWFETHFQKKTKKWCDLKSEDIYNQMCAMKEKVETEGPPMTVDETFDTVLTPRSGYARGRGHVLKPHSQA
ncbi:hypothetical protein FNV43_RR13342 [Rhamnella rubrinervis]|uniref:Transposase n=1 Tax=Rhamnella rubrinervis TaxID=2594499 RepID=A0A8K0H0X6_9ROSA|nr:hypothetical protein FNV43_RR13342 [Rhamnella rubrinervis]